MAVRDELLEELLKDYRNPEDLLGENGILKELSKRLIEKALQGELTHHVGHEKHGESLDGNYRNGSSKKTVKGKNGSLELEIPRDRKGTFEPHLIRKHQRRFDGFDEKILSMYSRGMTVRDIQNHLKDIYGTEVSPDLISTVTDSVLEDMRAWQNRPLESIYPVIFMDAIFVKIRDNGHITNKAIYFALGVTLEGEKELLGMWLSQNEGAKFWLSIITELKNRGIEDIFIACIDGLKGFPEAIESIFPKTQVQLCIVHMIRNSLKYVSWKERKTVVGDLKQIYTAPNEAAALEALDRFDEKYSSRFPTIAQMWRRNWTRIIPFLAYPEPIRKLIYTTNSIESMHHSVRKVTKNRGAFPNDEAALKLVYMATKNIAKKWKRAVREWIPVLNQLAIIFDDRMPFQNNEKLFTQKK